MNKMSRAKKLLLCLSLGLGLGSSFSASAARDYCDWVLAMCQSTHPSAQSFCQAYQADC